MRMRIVGAVLVVASVEEEVVVLVPVSAMPVGSVIVVPVSVVVVVACHIALRYINKGLTALIAMSIKGAGYTPRRTVPIAVQKSTML